MLRRAAVAGSWYSASPDRLATDVTAYLNDAADRPAGTGELVALVAPHAGLMYSGPVAAYAYQWLRHHTFDLIILIGPSHYVPFDGVSVWPEGAFETPFGPLAVDEEVAAALMARCPKVISFPAAHAREHSLEMQMPFLGVLARETRIVPLVMGQQTRATAFAVADAVAEVAQSRRALLIASSDLSHFYDADMASSLDAVVLDHVTALQDDGLMRTLEQRPDHACGGGPMVSVLRAAKALGATRGEVLRYGDSGDVSGDKSSVVGYMAAALWR